MINWYKYTNVLLYSGKHQNLMDWPRGYKTFFMLNSTANEISTVHYNLNAVKIKIAIAFNLSFVVFIMLINVKMPTIVGILTFVSRTDFMLS